MGPYYANAGPEDGILLYRDVAGSIDVFEDSDRSTAIGTARCIGWDAAGSAVWRLEVEDDEVPSPWLVVDREFLSTRPDWSDLYRGDSHHDLGRSGWASRRGKFRARERTRARTRVQQSPS
jgi:hypothetical protein